MDVQGKNMDNLLVAYIIESLAEAAKKSAAKAYLGGSIARHIYLDKKTRVPNKIDCVLDCKDSFSVGSFYKHILKRITVNKEIENSENKYVFVSYPYVVDCTIYHGFDPETISPFTVDRLYLDAFSKSPFAEIADLMARPPILCKYEPITDKNITLVTDFAFKVGEYEEYTIEPGQLAILQSINLQDLREPIGYKLSDIIVDLLVTDWPGNALSFFVDVFNDGRQWLANKLVKTAISLNIPVAENTVIHSIVDSKKFELVNIYNEFFLSTKIETESVQERKNRLVTSLKLLLDSPALKVEMPYIDSVSVLLSAEKFDNISIMSANEVESNSDITLSLFAAEGACCMGDGSCIEVDNTDGICNFLGGDFRGVGTTCKTQVCFPDVPGDCLYPPCEPCDPTECGTFAKGGQPCCCCSSVDIISQINLECHQAIMISCSTNNDGNLIGPGPDINGVEQDGFGECITCEDICNDVFAGQDVSPWFSPLSGCSSHCSRYSTEDSDLCTLYCVTCKGDSARCQSSVAVTAEDCAYLFNITPSTGCCGLEVGFDVVFVLDKSGSMADEIADISAGISAFVDAGIARGVILKLGLVLFSDPNDIVLYGWNTNGTLNSTTTVQESNSSIPGQGPGSLDYTLNTDEFKSALDTVVLGGGSSEPGFAACNYGIHYDLPGAFGKILIVVSDEDQSTGAWQSPPTLSNIVTTATAAGYKIFYIGPLTGNEQLAIQTGGESYNIAAALDWTAIFDDASGVATLYPSSCDCIDDTPIPVVRAVGDSSDPENYFPQCDCSIADDCSGLPPVCYHFPIGICNAPLTQEWVCHLYNHMKMDTKLLLQMHHQI